MAVKRGGAKGLKSKGKKSGKAKEQTAPFENPLVPNKTLQQMYQKMLELRLLDRYMSKLGRKAKVKIASTFGQEASRVSVVQGLAEGDVVMDAQAGFATAHLLGAKLPTLLKEIESTFAEERKRDAVSVPGQLPWVKDAEARLFAAEGAALLMKASKRANVVVVYVQHGEVARGIWRRVLGFAARHDLPMMFVVAREAGKKKAGSDVADVSSLAVARGVPGIPVDESDAIALYRVAQESLGRIRNGGGPVLVECIAFRVEAERKVAAADAIEQMKHYLLARKVCTEAWTERVAARFEERLAAGQGDA